jgi:hypothetical protein
MSPEWPAELPAGIDQSVAMIESETLLGAPSLTSSEARCLLKANAQLTPTADKSFRGIIPELAADRAPSEARVRREPRHVADGDQALASRQQQGSRATDSRVPHGNPVADEHTILGVLASLAEVPLNDDVRAAASTLGPVELRTLDAIHLALALTLGDDLAGVLTYDSRMQRAALASGISVLAPEPAPTRADDQQEETTD